MSDEIVRLGEDEEEARKIEAIVMQGDLGALTRPQQMQYVEKLCKFLGISPLAKPFEWIILNGKKTLYATRNCADQLRATRGISIEILERQEVNGIYIVRAKATMVDGRTDESIGAVNIKGKSGEDLANCLMKCETKAKRRVTYSITGLSFLDELEVETIPKGKVQTGTMQRIVPQPLPDPSVGRVRLDEYVDAEITKQEAVDQSTGEILDTPPPVVSSPGMRPARPVARPVVRKFQPVQPPIRIQETKGPEPTET